MNEQMHLAIDQSQKKVKTCFDMIFLEYSAYFGRKPSNVSIIKSAQHSQVQNIFPFSLYSQKFPKFSYI